MTTLRRLLFLPALTLALAFVPALVPVSASASALPTETAPNHDNLKTLVERQNRLLAIAGTKTTQPEISDMENEFQKLVHAWDDLIAARPDSAAACVSYAALLNHPLIGERRRAARLLLRANQLDPGIPRVKNELGNYMAEEGHPLDALQYYLEAIRLDEKEPLYHYQLGTLLIESRDAFEASGNWTPATLDKTILEAFGRAATLAPDRIDYAWRHAMAWYDQHAPDWKAALAAWQALAPRMRTPLEKQAIHLHEANILIRLDRRDEARARIDQVDAPPLAGNRQRLLDELAASPAPGGPGPETVPRILFPLTIPTPPAAAPAQPSAPRRP
jgi:tetratricopeptide (TPR) repeat protein